MNREMLDAYIKQNGKIRVGLAGAGYIAKGFVNQAAQSGGIEIVAMSSRTESEIRTLLEKGGFTDAKIFTDPMDLVTADLDVVIDLTGDVELGSRLAEGAILNGKHIVTSAETDATVGPVLGEMAEKAGVVYTNMWGDEPGMIKSLYDYATILGLEVVTLGKFKGYHNVHRNPSTVVILQNQNPYKMVSFADGTKMSMEMTVVSNATGYVPDVRGMNLPEGKFEDVLGLLQMKENGGVLTKEKVIEVIRGPKPSGAVFIMVKADNTDIIESLKYYKMGEGPYYMLYIPYHMPGIEMIFGIYEMMLFGKASIKPLARPYSDVITIAKRDLEEGQILDKIGGYDYYGINTTIEDSMMEEALPTGLAEDGKLLRAVKEGEIIRFSDVEIRHHDCTYRLRKEYSRLMGN
jgi:predicted homoserine dehydrogenase-like protein